MGGTKHGDAFGKGLYFADNCMKCDEYTSAAPRGHEFDGLRPLILCRVLLGRLAVSVDKDVSYELEKVTSGSCDSLLADRSKASKTFREFIVFDEDKVCAEYILWYRQSHDRVESPPGSPLLKKPRDRMGAGPDRAKSSP